MSGGPPPGNFLNFSVSDLISCILGDTYRRAHFSGVSLLRKDHYFLLSMVILLIFTLKRDYHWGGMAKSCHWGAEEEPGGAFALPSYIVKNCPNVSR